MKKRIKMDSAILSMIIILTGFLYLMPGLYTKNAFLDNAMDFLGFFLILIGIVLRMAARGHKKKFSHQGHGLVKSGLYKYTRNPMYLGSCLLGSGFVLLLWPWWCLPIFLYLFYLRFKKQVAKEEKYLTGVFGEEYSAYCQKVPRVLPRLKAMKKFKVKQTLPVEELLDTKDRRGFVAWPLVGILLETFQERIVFGSYHPAVTFAMCLLAYVVFLLSYEILYHQKN